jgi:phenylpyruvate tautomerase PptA (4-oxalocrotonate tautomerase family)
VRRCGRFNGFTLRRTARTSMPILDVEIVTSGSLDSALAANLADMAAQVFGGPPASTWVRVRTLPKEHYAENGVATPEGWRSVFVTVRKAQRPTGSALEAEARALAEGVARVCSRPVENVHILYEPDAQGRIAFGGKLRP